MVDIRQGWSVALAGLSLNGAGNRALLTRPMTAFFSSRDCPAAAIRAGLEWGLAQARAGGVVIGGFHSPLERSVMRLLLEAGHPLVAVIGRDPAAARLPADWRAPLEHGTLAVISATRDVRLTTRTAAMRNELVFRLATEIVVAWVAAQGELSRQVVKWRESEGRWVHLLSS